MRNPKLIIYAEPILKLLTLKDDNLNKIADKLKLTEDDVTYVMGYLKDKEAVSFVKTNGRGFGSIRCLQVTSSGAEIALGKRELIDKSETNVQQMNINAPVQNAGQVQGDQSHISQLIDNSKLGVLKQMIESDTDIDKTKRKKLLEYLERFNTLKESGENAMDLIGKVCLIATKYTPYFFSLLQ